MEKMNSQHTTGSAKTARASHVAIAASALGIVVAIAVLSLVTQGASAKTSPAAPSDCGQAWRVITSPNSGTSSNILLDVAVISDSDVWVVGTYTDISNPNVLGMAEHWNGSVWSLVTVPQPGTRSFLQAVSAVSSDDVWAVGYYYNAEAVSETLIIHYDGTNWTQVTSPNVGTSYNGLYDIAAVSADSAWAVGSSASGNTTADTVLYWDGSNWASVQSPSPDYTDYLQGVTATGADDMWAVGFAESSDGHQPSRSFALHCTRAACTVATTPNSGVGNNDLERVSALSPSDVWAVGYSETMTMPTTTSIPTMMHWNGEGWSMLPTPPLPNGNNYNDFHDVVPLSDSAVWGVGATYNSSNRTGQPYAALWTGSGWTVSTPLNVSPADGFEGGGALGVNDLWGVGASNGSDNTSTTLVEHYNDPCITPTPTPPACSVDFTDVPQGSTFYPYVHCLSCQNILGGYTTGCPTGSPCFKPSSPVTRGQLAKIVSNAAGFGDVHIDQAFEDVPVGSTFYDFVARLASRSIIGGYPCGGAGEPCGSDNLPYFRPNTNVTRGQNAKIVAIADNLPAPTPGQQTFEDVAVGSTFWQWVESLSTAGAVSGYPCGGAGEPCVAPGNLPYFRPNSNVTRGQAAKIVSNTFFPDCQSK